MTLKGPECLIVFVPPDRKTAEVLERQLSYLPVTVRLLTPEKLSRYSRELRDRLPRMRGRDVVVFLLSSDALRSGWSEEWRGLASSVAGGGVPRTAETRVR